MDEQQDWETYFTDKDKHRLTVKGWKKIFHAKENQKETRAIILISDKVNLKTRTIKQVKEGHYIMIKGSIH